MSIGTPNGILDITGATLRVSKMEFRQSTGFDTVLNNVARNTMLLMDETEQTTSNSWALKLPNAWVAEFHGYWASGSSGAPILFNFYNDSTSGTNGYTLSMNDTTISINYDGGSTLGSATLSSTLNNDTYRKVAVIFERSVLDVSVDGEHVFHFADSQLRDRVYDNNSGYVTFAHSSTDERKLKNLKFTNGDKWIREIDSSNIAYVGGNVGIGTTIPGTKLDVSGTVRGTHLIGDGSAISAIQSSNVSDFGSNVTRIGTLETDLGDNSSRITNLSSNLSDNSSRITALESGDISISGDKTFTGDIIFESNIHMNGGNVLVANTVNMTVSDPIIELGLNNIGTNDLGIIMTRPAANSNVAVVFDESDDILRMGYTLNGASDSIVDLDSNALAVSVQGALSAGSNLEVGTANLFVDTTTSRVGIGMSNPSYTLDVDGDINLSTGSTLKINGTDAVFSNWTVSGSDIYRSSGNVGIGMSNPSYTLDVDGDINLSTGSTLKINGTDAVFSNWTVSGSDIYRSSGNVGIGTNNPGAPLQITASGDTKTTGTPASNGLYVYNPTNSANQDACIAVRVAGSSAGDPFVSFDVANDAGWCMGIDNSDSNKFKFCNNWYDLNQDAKMTIDTSGNVGIGTTSPTARLDVEYNQGTLSSYNYSTTSTWHGKGLRLAGGSNSGGFLYGHDINHSIFLRQSPFSTNDHNAYCNVGYHAFYTGGHIQNQTERLRITSDGKVGIGTTNPTHQLHIGPKDNDHIYLASSNNSYGWTIDTDDQGSGTVPFRIIKRTDGVDSTVLTIKNQDGKVGIGTSNSPTELLHVCARSSSESAFIRIQSGSGGTNPATESGIKLTESGQYGFQFVHSAVTDLLKVKHQDSNGSVDKDDIMVWHPNGAVQWGVTSRYNFHYNPNTWGYSTNLYNTTTNFWSVNYYFDHEGYVFVTSYGHWTRKDANNSGHAGGNEAFYGWISVDNKEVADSSLYDNFSGSTSSYNKFHEYQSPDTSGAGAWRDFSHTALYKVSAGWHSFSLRVTVFFGSSHYLNINGSGLNGFYIPKHYL
jgi:hypothetical protein